MNESFKLESNYKLAGDQPSAVKSLVKNIKEKKRFQTLLGATGTGKTFTVANIIQEVQKPTLVMAPNKTLAAQLYNEYAMRYSVHQAGLPGDWAPGLVELLDRWRTYFARPAVILRSYHMADLRPDMLAAVTVALVALPQAIAYASIANLPPHYEWLHAWRQV